MSETRALQGYAYWHPDTGCEWHSALTRLPHLTISERAEGWRVVPVTITIACDTPSRVDMEQGELRLAA
jgi:hypothetical protein